MISSVIITSENILRLHVRTGLNMTQFRTDHPVLSYFYARPSILIFTADLRLLSDSAHIWDAMPVVSPRRQFTTRASGR